MGIVYKIILFIITIISNSIMDAIMSNNSFAKYGLWFSRDGWKIKYLLRDWLSKYIPFYISKFIAFNILVVFTELYKLCKMIMIMSFMFLIFGLNINSLYAYLLWGILFSFVYSIIR